MRDHATALKFNLRIINVFYFYLGMIVSMPKESWNCSDFSKLFVKSCEKYALSLEFDHEMMSLESISWH